MQHLIAKVRFQIAVGRSTDEPCKGGHAFPLHVACNGHAASTIGYSLKHPTSKPRHPARLAKQFLFTSVIGFQASLQKAVLQASDWADSPCEAPRIQFARPSRIVPGAQKRRQ